jgi:hypothetical protein
MLPTRTNVMNNKHLPVISIFISAAALIVALGVPLVHNKDVKELRDLESLVTVQSRHLADVEASLKAHIDEKPAKKGDKK